MRLIEAESVTLVRGGRLLFEALDLHLDAGETLHVTGPNGSGKSSLIRLLAGLLQPAAGRIFRAGPAALVDEHSALDRELPLIAALDFWLGRTGDRQKLASALTAFDLAALNPVPVRLLSTGQLKRATLARVVASDSRLWLLDEPTNGLDAQGLSDLSEVIDAHLAKGGAIIAASHGNLPGEWRRLELGH